MIIKYPYDCWLEIYNIVDSPGAEFMSRFSLGRGVYDVIADNGYAYFYDFYELELEIEIIDATNPYQPILGNNFFSNGRIDDIDINGEYLFVAFDTLGFAALDFTDPAVPLQLWSGELPTGLDIISSENNIAIVNDKAAHSHKLVLFDISNIDEPESISTYQASAKPIDIEILDNYVYLNGDNGTIEIVDISNPEHPAYYNHIDFITGANSILLQDSRAYVACGNEGLKILDVSDPSNPVLAGDFNRSFMNITVIGVKDTIAYLANGAEGVIIVNIADLQNIVPVNELNFDFSVDWLTVVDDYLCCKARLDGIYLYGLEDPVNPYFIEYYRPPYNIGEILEKDGYFILNDHSSIIILQPASTGIEQIAEIPMQFSLAPNYPNPFNATTTISYNLPQASEVTLDIYDVLGRKVHTLRNGYQSAGPQSAVWNADGFSSGVYFYRLTAGELQRFEKMVLLK